MGDGGDRPLYVSVVGTGNAAENEQEKKKGPKEDEAVRGRVVGAEGDTARDGYHAKWQVRGLHCTALHLVFSRSARCPPSPRHRVRRGGDVPM